MVSWAVINTFGFPVALFALRNGFSYYRSLKATYHLRKNSIQPTPPPVALALNILFVAVAVSLVATLPYFSPPNIFAETNTRLQTTTDVIFKRLSELRVLTPLDNLLRDRLTSKESRLFYFAYGPYTVAYCPFCTAKEPISYLLYGLPNLLAPHLLHLFLLGLVTTPGSSLGIFPAISDTTTSPSFRTPFTLAALGLAVADVYFLASYDVAYNTRATSSTTIEFFFWRARLLRCLAFAVVDAAAAGTLWLAATNRFFLAPVTSAQRLDAAVRAVDAGNRTLWGAGAVRNAVVRDQSLGEVGRKYWEEERKLYTEEREVVQAVNAAAGRVNMTALSNAAETSAEAVVRTMDQMQDQQHQQQQGQGQSGGVTEADIVEEEADEVE